VFTACEKNSLKSFTWFKENQDGLFIFFAGHITSEGEGAEIPVGSLLSPSSIKLRKKIIHGLPSETQIVLEKEAEIFFISKQVWNYTLKRDGEAKKLRESLIFHNLFFSDLNSRNLAYKLQENSSKHRYIRNQNVFKEGEKPEAIYVIKRGEIGVRE
jgi:hypothetical protein